VRIRDILGKGLSVPPLSASTARDHATSDLFADEAKVEKDQRPHTRCWRRKAGRKGQPYRLGRALLQRHEDLTQSPGTFLRRDRFG
jgi:hypothetical protein